jgi:hypothetical protein
MSDSCRIGCLRTAAILACASLAWASVQFTQAQEAPARPASDPARTELLIKQLGSEDFTEREAATDELTRLGLAAFAPLEAAAVHPDREVRYRSIRILAQIRDLDMQRRLDAFLSGKESAGEYPLPGWSRFAKAYGDQSQSRQLFVELQRADPELLRSIEEGPQGAAELLTQRIGQHQQAMQFGGGQQLTLGQVAALVFVAAEEDVTVADHTMSMVLNYCHQQAVREVMNNPTKKEIPRKMIGAAVRRSEDNSAYQAMNLAMSYGMDDGMVPALKILKAGGRVPHMSLYALMTVAKLGDQSHLPLVEKLLDDKAVVTRSQENNVIHEVQVRDAALAAAVMLTKQELKSYFTGRGDLTVSEPQQVFFNPKLIGFPPEAVADGKGAPGEPKEDPRAPAIKKWQEYKASQPQKDAAAPEPAKEAPAKAAPADEAK